MVKKKKKDKSAQEPIIVVSPHTGGVVDHLVYSFLYGSLFIVLIMNVLVSQTIPDSYFSLWNGESGSLVNFFKEARDLPAFKSLYKENKVLVSQYQGEIYADERQMGERIAKLEQILQINPQSPDVLYSLSLLYDKSGDTEKGSSYLERARMIDPQIGR